MQNSMPRIRITSLNLFQLSSVVFACKTSWLAAELQVSMCPRPHLSSCACKTACLASELLVSMGPRPNLSIFAFKTPCLALELLVSIGPSPPLWFLNAKLDYWTRITSLYGSQIWPVVLCMQISVFTTWKTSVYGSLPSTVDFACKTASLCAELCVSIGPRPHLCFFLSKQRLLEWNNKSPWVPDMTCRFVHVQQRA